MRAAWGLAVPCERESILTSVGPALTEIIETALYSWTCPTTERRATVPLRSRARIGSTPLSEALTPAQQEQHAELLASRLRTLMDITTARTGTEVTFTDVSEYLATRDITLSRSRWSYILNGHRYTDDVRLVDAVSDFFEVPHSYLRGEEELEMVAAELDLVRAMRAMKVRTFAARTLGDLSPQALGAITKILDQEAARAGEA